MNKRIIVAPSYLFTAYRSSLKPLFGSHPADKIELSPGFIEDHGCRI
jgi:hypothetical protein